ncbi:hypothetical protein K1719_006539 [Acacia pycnantha]|nr:hypothetical protein K1719_006539 [Acacia pycnantha]
MGKILQVDLVTHSDKACEDLIFNHLKKLYPTHKVWDFKSLLNALAESETEGAQGAQGAASVFNQASMASCFTIIDSNFVREIFAKF